MEEGEIISRLVVLGFVLGFLGACGGEVDDASVIDPDEVGAVASEIQYCSGYGSCWLVYCTVRCNDWQWHTVGDNFNTAYGDCTNKGNNWCYARGMYPTGSCWSSACY